MCSFLKRFFKNFEKKKFDKYQPPSKEFEDAAFDSMGTVHGMCELCGRVHFSSGQAHNFNDKKELDDLLDNMRKHPDRYINHSTESVWIGNIDGKQVVIGCECNELTRYEKFIWENRFLIISYLESRFKKDLEEAKEQNRLLEQIQV